MIKGLITAFSMYSSIPMPRVELDENSMKYTMACFPLVGALIGGFVWLWAWVCAKLGIGSVLFAAVLTLLPVSLSGAIHIDGLIDTGDAMYSRQPIEKKLEILKDPHVGAFGIILCCGYFLLFFAFATELLSNHYIISIVCRGFVLSRALSAFSVVTLSKAKDTGLAFMFGTSAQQNFVRIASLLFVTAVSVGMVAVHPVIGGAAVLLCALWFLRFWRMSKRQFGGITGDLCGYLLCVTELIVLGTTAIGAMLW